MSQEEAGNTQAAAITNAQLAEIIAASFDVPLFPEWTEVWAVEQLLPHLTPVLDNVLGERLDLPWRTLVASTMDGLQEDELHFIRNFLAKKMDDMIDLPEVFEWVDDVFITAVLETVITALRKGSMLGLGVGPANVGEGWPA